MGSKIEHIRKLTAKSKATNKDVEELAETVKAGMWKRHEEK